MPCFSKEGDILKGGTLTTVEKVYVVVSTVCNALVSTASYREAVPEQVTAAGVSLPVVQPRERTSR